ncbi:hypothetical protein FVE85_3237 [Porphyridium purpureum]|uniref:Uncharacterized protein n=1 Tax=Porphyridium purpureum TaxID=35688 RepID=A0A5J4YUG7_PORPP|nr:hypothetical protein FVE85_3237 [Porphyridium purpureum]|eukprot:POR1051..scf227_4
MDDDDLVGMEMEDDLMDDELPDDDAGGHDADDGSAVFRVRFFPVRETTAPSSNSVHKRNVIAARFKGPMPDLAAAAAVGGSQNPVRLVRDSEPTVAKRRKSRLDTEKFLKSQMSYHGQLRKMANEAAKEADRVPFRLSKKFSLDVPRSDPAANRADEVQQSSATGAACTSSMLRYRGALDAPKPNFGYVYVVLNREQGTCDMHPMHSHSFFTFQPQGPLLTARELENNEENEDGATADQVMQRAKRQREGLDRFEQQLISKVVSRNEESEALADFKQEALMQQDTRELTHNGGVQRLRRKLPSQETLDDEEDEVKASAGGIDYRKVKSESLEFQDEKSLSLVDAGEGSESEQPLTSEGIEMKKLLQRERGETGSNDDFEASPSSSPPRPARGAAAPKGYKRASPTSSAEESPIKGAVKKAKMEPAPGSVMPGTSRPMSSPSPSRSPGSFDRLMSYQVHLPPPDEFLERSHIINVLRAVQRDGSTLTMHDFVALLQKTGRLAKNKQRLLELIKGVAFVVDAGASAGGSRQYRIELKPDLDTSAN